MKKSDFGKGLTYCLGLFLCHDERKIKEGESAMIWFNGAADHLYDLEIPDSLPNNLPSRLEDFKNSCLKWRLTDPTLEDKNWAIKTAKMFLLEIDRHFKIKAEEAEWS